MAATCPACRADAFVENGSGGTCTRCGYASGDANRCPHCGATARTEGAGEKTVCAMCGSPRIPGGRGGAAAVAALREQKKHLSAARLASVATVAQAVFAAIATLIGLAIMPHAIIGKAIVFAIALVPILLAMRSRSRAKSAREAARAAGEQAWQAAAEEVASAGAGVTVPALAKTLGVEPAYAEKLLTSLAVHDRTRIDVSDDAEVVYSAGPEALAREAAIDEQALAENEPDPAVKERAR